MDTEDQDMIDWVNYNHVFMAQRGYEPKIKYVPMDNADSSNQTTQGMRPLYGACSLERGEVSA
jgi:hypothetical protein